MSILRKAPLPPDRSPGISGGPVPFAFAGLFVVFLAVLALAGRLPAVLPGIYLASSLAAFAAYAFDKSAARNNRWRTRETTLHLLGLMGGWPGALVAQSYLRHKSKKRSFQLVFRATVVLNCAVLIFLVRTLRL